LWTFHQSCELVNLSLS